MSCNTTIARLVVCFCLLAASVPSAFAATRNKVSTGTDLTSNLSWQGATAPGPSDTATWSQLYSSRGSGLTLGSSKQWSAISVSDAASDIDISGAGTLTNGNITLGGVNLSIANNITVSGSPMWAVASGKTLTLSGTILMSSGSLMINNASTASTVISGIVTGTGGITNTGAGTLTLSGTNTYTGGTVVSAGTLTINGSGSLGAGSYSGAISNGGTMTFGSSAAQTLAGPISGNGLLTVSGGTVTLSGNNAYTGGIILSSGQLNINSSTALGAAAGTFTIAGTSTIDNTSAGAISNANNNAQSWNADFTFAGSQGLNLGTGAVTLGGNRQVTVSANTLTVGGAIGGGYSLTKAGGGTLTLSGNNTFTGALSLNPISGSTTILSGDNTSKTGATHVYSTAGGSTGATLQLQANGGNTASGVSTALGSASYTGLNVGVNGNGTSQSSGATIQLRSDSSVTFAGGNSMGGLGGATFTVDVNQLTSGNSNNVITFAPGGFNIANTVINVTGGNGYSLIMGNITDVFYSTGITLNPTTANVTVTNIVNNGHPVTLTGSGNATVAGVISGTGGLTKSDSGMATLLGVNTYTGGTVVNAGTLTISGSGSLGGGSYSGAISNGGTMTFSSSVAQTLAGPVSGSGTLSVSGSTVTLSGTNTFYGQAKIVGGGVLSVSSVSKALGNVSDINLGGSWANGTLLYTGTGETSDRVISYTAFNGSDFDPNQIIDQSGSGLLKFTSAFSQGGGRAHYLILQGSTSGAGEIAGDISGSGGATTVVKNGTGTWTLSGTNTYTGGTVVNAGTLALGSAGSISNSPNLILAAGGTFDVSAISTFNLSSNTVLQASGTGAAPGSTAATINGGGTVNLNTNAIILNFTPVSFSGDTTHPALLVTNASLTLNNNGITITNAAATPLGAGVYRLVQVGNGSSGSISGTPNATPVAVSGSGIASGMTAVLSVSSGNLNLTVQNNTTNTLALTSGSNPSTYGNSVTFSATISPAPTNGESVTFKDGATTLGTGTISAGVAAFSISTLAYGSHSITAVYSGDIPSTSDALAFNVNQAVVTVASGLTANNKTYTGTTAATISSNNVALSGVIAGDSGNVALSTNGYTATFATAAVGTGKTVTVSGLTLAGSAAGNYTLTQPSLSANITAAGTSLAVSSSANPAPTGSNVTFTATLTAVAPGAGTPTGTVQFLSDGSPLGSPETLASGVASLTTNSLSHGSHTISAEYGGDGNFFGSTNTLGSSQIINTRPDAVADALQRGLNCGVKVRTATLLANDTDADSDSLTMSSISSTSTEGGTVTTLAPWVFYTPLAGFTNSDSFSCVITDGGLPATNTVSITIQQSELQSVNSAAVENLGNGSYRIRFSGIPGRSYTVQYAESLETPSWQTLGTRTASAIGQFEFTDTPGTGAPERFYRTTQP